VIVAAPATLEKLLPEVRELWKGRLNAATSMADYLEFTSVQSDKAAALKFLCEHLGVPREESAAVGDGRNDASMLEWAGLGVAVQGSAPEVMKAAHERAIAGPGHGGIEQLANLLLR
jgi:hydroxymethylpyrimidine pyrophosphatase-like HAD family hydrolase